MTRRATRMSLVAGAAALGAATLTLVALGSGAVASDDSAAADTVATAPAAPAGQDRITDQEGICGDARYDAEVDREDGGLESSFEIDDAQPGQRWQITATHNGVQYVDEVLTTDHEGEIEVERLHTDADGVDEFVMTAKRLDGAGDCSVTLRR
jgi:hypothetical protein